MPHVCLTETILKRTDSLKRKKEFRYTYRVGRSVPGSYTVLIYARNRSRMTRVGFSVSKKIGNAIVRNRVKRRLREAVTPLLPGIRAGFNLIFIAHASLTEAPFSSIGAQMLGQIRKAGLLAEKIP